MRPVEPLRTGTQHHERGSDDIGSDDGGAGGGRPAGGRRGAGRKGAGGAPGGDVDPPPSVHHAALEVAGPSVEPSMEVEADDDDAACVDVDEGACEVLELDGDEAVAAMDESTDPDLAMVDDMLVPP